MLKLNSIEVMYSDVILVLKGVSLEVPPERSSPFWGPTGPGRPRPSKPFQAFSARSWGKWPTGPSNSKRQMLAIGRALMGKPKIMLLDEPSMGLSPIIVKEIFRLLKQINQQEGGSILLQETYWEMQAVIDETLSSLT